jgi:hypothetical protein
MQQVADLTNAVSEVKAMITNVNDRVTRMRDGFNERNRDIIRQIGVVRQMHQPLELTQLNQWRTDIEHFLFTGENRDTFKQWVIENDCGIVKMTGELRNYTINETADFLNHAKKGDLEMPQLDTINERLAALEARVNP